MMGLTAEVLQAAEPPLGCQGTIKWWERVRARAGSGRGLALRGGEEVAWHAWGGRGRGLGFCPQARRLELASEEEKFDEVLRCFVAILSYNIVSYHKISVVGHTMYKYYSCRYKKRYKQVASLRRNYYCGIVGAIVS